MFYRKPQNSNNLIIKLHFISNSVIIFFVPQHCQTEHHVTHFHHIRHELITSFESYCHIRSAACISGFGDGVHQLPADAKITQLNVACPVQEDIRWLYVCREITRELIVLYLNAEPEKMTPNPHSSHLCE